MESREIKFRGKRLTDSEWIYGYYFVNRGEHFIVKDELAPTGNTFLDYEVDEKTVGQFSGYTDINNKEIYEDDIVQDKYGSIGRICFTMYGWSIDYGGGDIFILSECINDNDGIKIIGNYFENPELLK